MKRVAYASVSVFALGKALAAEPAQAQQEVSEVVCRQSAGPNAEARDHQAGVVKRGREVVAAQRSDRHRR